MYLGIKAVRTLRLSGRSGSKNTCAGTQMDANIAALHVAFVEAYFIEVLERCFIECSELPLHILIISITSVHEELASERVAI